MQCLHERLGHCLSIHIHAREESASGHYGHRTFLSTMLYMYSSMSIVLQGSRGFLENRISGGFQRVSPFSQKY